MAELADAYGSGPYGGNPMEVQVLSPAPFEIERPASAGLFASRKVRCFLPVIWLKARNSSLRFGSDALNLVHILTGYFEPYLAQWLECFVSRFAP